MISIAPTPGPPIAAGDSHVARPCLICSQAARHWLHVPRDWRRPDDEHDHHLYWCDDCDCGWLHPRPTPPEVAAFYNVRSYYTHHTGNNGAAVPSSATHRLLRRIAWQFDQGCAIGPDHLRMYANGHQLRICDLGCGNGELLHRMLQSGHQGIGVEPDDEARRRARERGLRVLNGTAEHLPPQLDREHFDFVIMQHVLEHCLDPTRAMHNAASLLKRNGLLIIEVPNNEAIGLERAGPTWRWLDVPRHLNFFTKKSLTRLSERTGLNVDDVEYVGYTRQFSREWLETEAQIQSCFAGRTPSRDRSSLLSAWRLLGRTLLAPPERKYDSVRLVLHRDRNAASNARTE